jgi:conjugal transfer/type IV secretion protein DotA/TraY
MFKIIKRLSEWKASILGLALMMSSPLLFATSANDVDLSVKATDQSVLLLLEPLFGSAVIGSNVSPLGDIFALLNSIVLMLGGIFLAYTMVIGTLNTAHDGEMLGKKWSSTMIPIRMSLGVAAIFPMANGFSMIQGLVLWAVMQGVGGANAMWDKFADTTATTPFHSVKLHDNAVMLTESILKSEVCAVSFNETMAHPNMVDNLGVQKIALTPYASAGSEYLTSFSKGYGYTKVTSVGFNGNNYCGGFHYDLHQPKTLTEAERRTAVSSIASINAIDAENVDGKFNELNLYQLEQTKLIADKVRPLAKDLLKFANDDVIPSYDLNSKIHQIASEYETNVNNKAKSLYDSVSGVEDMKEALKKDGWLMAGSYYMKIVSLQEKISTMVSKMPTYTQPTSDLANTVFQNKEVMGRFGFLKSNNPEENATATFAKNEINIEDKSMFGKFVEDGLQTIGSTVVGNNSIFAPSDSNINPVTQAQITGNRLMIAGETGLVGSTILSAVPVVGNALFNITFPIAVALIGFGALLAIYIPFMPYILWMGAILGWIILVIEAVVAAPLWAAMHIHPHGDDFAGKGNAGYTLLLSLVFKPMLMIIGFIFAILLMNPVGQVINATFSATFNMINGDGFIGLFSVIAGLAIYISLMHHSITKIFGLINELPDHILRWVGHARESIQLGEYSQGMNKSSQNFFMSSIGRTSNVGQSMNMSGMKSKKDKDNKKDEGGGSSPTGSQSLENLGKQNIVPKNTDKTKK